MIWSVHFQAKLTMKMIRLKHRSHLNRSFEYSYYLIVLIVNMLERQLSS